MAGFATFVMDPRGQGSGWSPGQLEDEIKRDDSFQIIKLMLIPARDRTGNNQGS